MTHAEPQAVEVVEASGAVLQARVLVVDDVAMNREIARLMLSAAGCEVVEAASGPEAIAILGAQAFDVVLMDLQMPGMDGLTATREIRKLAAAQAATPIVAMTANVLDEQVNVCLAAGMNGHLGKPFQRAELLAVVARFASARPGPELPKTVAEAAPQVTIFDPESLQALGAGPGSTLRRQLLESVLTLLDGALEADAGDPAGRAVLRAEAHDLVSAGGSLGFLGLSGACRILQNACDDPGADIEAPLATARDLVGRSRDEALRQIEPRADGQAA